MSPQTLDKKYMKIEFQSKIIEQFQFLLQFLPSFCWVKMEVPRFLAIFLVVELGRGDFDIVERYGPCRQLASMKILLC